MAQFWPYVITANIALTARPGEEWAAIYSAATIVNQKTGNLKLVQKLLGHSKLSTTADVYTHTTADADRRAVLALEEAIFPNLYQVGTSR